MTAVLDIVKHFQDADMPLRVAVELSDPDTLAAMWLNAHLFSIIRLLIITRPQKLLDTVESLPGISEREASSVRQEIRLSWKLHRVEFSSDDILKVVNDVAARAGGCPAAPGSSRGRLLRSADPACIAAEKSVLQAVRDAGPPTLQEIMNAYKAWNPK